MPVVVRGPAPGVSKLKDSSLVAPCAAPALEKRFERMVGKVGTYGDEAGRSGITCGNVVLHPVRKDFYVVVDELLSSLWFA